MKYITEGREATVSAKISLGWKSDIDFRQHVHSLRGNFSSEIKRMLDKFEQYACEVIFFKFFLLNIIQDLN